MDFQIFPVAEASVTTLMQSISRVIINPLITFLFALAVIYFIYGLAKYLLTPDNEELKNTSKQHMLWGIFGMFIMIAVFGILNILLKTLGEEKIKIQNNGDYTVGKML